MTLRISAEHGSQWQQRTFSTGAVIDLRGQAYRVLGDRPAADGGTELDLEPFR